ncbi:methyltransferase [Nonomuraea rubra]|uniref:Putative RNA methylase n=1 Tax=Nonomuraea rubra TaxID=46180 RepID=A0A7X0P6N0_9ACTN|nr:methyltransferase [Nonomuraea rubra]MBB6556241.1 putative RNA methylase [Nonomuraea rubra]
MRVSTDVLAEIDALVIDGNQVRIAGQMEYAFYKKVDKVLQATGGKWNRKAKAHLFDGDPSEVLEQVLLTGQITTPQDLGYFPTPPTVVEHLLDLANLSAGSTVLEPSAGTGAIAGPMAARGLVVDCVELDPERAAVVREAGYARQVLLADFLTVQLGDLAGERYDAAVMNPPFAKQADITHVRHALDLVKPGGRLVSVMSISVSFRTNRTAADFRALLDERGGEVIPLPEDAFRESGTGVRTAIVVIPA